MRTTWTWRLALVVAVAVALVTCSAALAGGGVLGTYTTTITKPSSLKGTWGLTLAKGGKYTVSLNGEVGGRGTYSATSTTITLRETAHGGCGGAGTYGWKKSGKSLTFVRKHEAKSCGLRAAVLSHRFTQVR